MHLRDSAVALLSSNLGNAFPTMFANPASADLHLVASATNAIDQAPFLPSVTNDFDGDTRPRGARSDTGADEFTTNAHPRISDLHLSGTNTIVSLTTFLGESYDVQRATDVAGGSWLFVATNLPGTGGTLQVTDTNGASQPRRFYRAELSP
jgi:hypothetical protein